jgi:hypothetical protein
LRALADAAGEERYEQLGLDLSEESEELQLKPFTPNQLRAKLGDVLMKGIEEPIAIYHVSCSGVRRVTPVPRSHKSARSADRRVLVLPVPARRKEKAPPS